MEEHITGKGKVVWSVRRRSDASQKPLFYDTGIEFVDLPEEDIKRIEKIIQYTVANSLHWSLFGKISGL